LKRLLLLAMPLAISLLGCAHGRKGGELRLKHEVTVATPEGEHTFTSVVSMEGLQTYNYGAGTSGWGGISCRLTGNAVRVPVGDKDFYFLLNRESTPAWDQIELVKQFFGLPNATNDDSWVAQWKQLASSDLAVLVPRDAYPRIAVMPRDGWMDDARRVTPEEAEQQGLRVVRYRLRMTRDEVGTDPSFKVRYRPEIKSWIGVIGRESFTVLNGTA
jgi:hypothetical protein